MIWAVPTYAVLIAIGVWFRAHRWVYLLRPIAPGASARRVVGVCFVGFAAILFAPLRLGEAARPYLLARDGKVSFFQALGAAGAERVVDGLVLMLVSAVAMTFATPLSPLPNRLGDMPVPVSAVPHAIYGALVVFASAFTALLVFYGAQRRGARFTHRLLDPLSTRLANFVTDTLERLADGLKVLASPHDRLRFFSETLLYWACTFLATWALMRGSGMAGSLAEACVSARSLGPRSHHSGGPRLLWHLPDRNVHGLGAVFRKRHRAQLGSRDGVRQLRHTAPAHACSWRARLLDFGARRAPGTAQQRRTGAHGAVAAATRSSNRF